ncbi:hypothetical protein [Pedococcus sp. 5OH_020]|uniref:hypothetical protein n=1 Tax=Pedococcus sp. 5OH_020 TaxID=2989814 RepID=UPI0022E9B1A3|nr:hypothetical protein [Pedococcus sp. 5OH_020]
MVGVSGPLNTYDRGAATRFLAGLATGVAATTVALALMVSLLATLWARTPTVPRVGLAVSLLLLLGALDLSDRTPELARQVPQRFARVLDPGARGLFWGADLATLVSTRKASSLLWVALVVAPLAGRPTVAVAGIVAANAAFVVGVTLQTKVPAASVFRGRLGAVNISGDIRALRRATGLLILLGAGLLLAGGLP